MYKLYFIAKNNMKKQKGDMITFFVLTFLSAFLIFNCASTLLGMGKVMDDKFAEINGAHVLLFVGDTEAENDSAEKAFENNSHIMDYEATPCLEIYTEYRNNKNDEWEEYQFFMESFEEDKRIMNVAIDKEDLSDDDILVPYFMKSKFAVGDTLQLRIDDTVYDFNVAGYVEDPYFSSSINITVYYCYISQKMTDILMNEQPDTVVVVKLYKGVMDESELNTMSVFGSVRAASKAKEESDNDVESEDVKAVAGNDTQSEDVKDKSGNGIEKDENESDEKDGLTADGKISVESDERDDGKEDSSEFTTMMLEQEITDSYKKYIAPYSIANPEANYTNYLSVNWQAMRGGAQFIPMIAMSVILVFAVLVLIIAIIIISFSIKNFINRNMKNTGILEASGYTVKELRAALTVQIVLVALAGSVCGIIIAILTSTQFGDIVSSILGLTWNQPVDYVMAFITVLSLMLVICLVTRTVSRTYKKITVLDALRGGINAHNFKKNYFPFETTPLPIPAVLSLKETFGGLGRNLLLVFIVAVLTISTLLGFGMMENFGSNPDNLIRIMGFEAGTLSVYGDESLAEDLESMDGVRNVIAQYGFEPVVSYGGKSQTVYTYAFDDIEKRQNIILLDGRVAKHDNEIVITAAVADDFSVNVGDVIKLSYADKSADYIITGIDQRMERMGRDISITFDGAAKLVPGQPEIQYLVTGEDGVTFDDLNKQVKELSQEKGIALDNVSDLAKSLNGTLSSLNLAMKLLCTIIVIITILVVIFVEALIIRAKLVREWRSFGISKALGMTSGQLISQIMMFSVPAIIAGTVIGALLSETAGSKICIASFSIFGLKKIAFSISPVWQIVTVVGILVVAVVTAGLFGLKTRGLEPVTMITEE